MRTTVVIPVSEPDAEAARACAAGALASGYGVVLAGPRPPYVPGTRAVEAGAEEALRAGLGAAETEAVLVHAPQARWSMEAARTVLQPIQDDAADAAYGASPGPLALDGRALAQLAGLASGVTLPEPFPALRAFRMEAVRPQLSRLGGGLDADVQLLVKLSAQGFRFTSVAVSTPRPDSSPERQLGRARALARYAGLQNDADNQHEGYNTLARLESAPNYNAWLGEQFRPWLGARVLEVGAGIGTITRQLAPGRELLVALEMDPFYAERLRNLFRGSPNVRPVLSGVEAADWARLREERFDTVVMSNVLEHIEDDVAALRNLRSVLPPGGRLLLLVPALQALFGSLDEAVGHHRRYGDAQLRRAVEAGGFDLEHLQWMNLVGIPGWLVNSRLLGRRAMPPLQMRLFDRVAPLLAAAEARVQLPVGLSLFVVARARP